MQANQCLERGTQKLEEGDIEAAKALYKRSVEIKKTASSLFNLGVTYYHLSESELHAPPSHLNPIRPEEYDDAIDAWKESIALQPSSPDAHTSKSPPLSLLFFPLIKKSMSTDLASAYIISPVARPDLALQHLQYVRIASAAENMLTTLSSIASSLAPEDPEIAFNLAAVLEACTF